jgi:hypothetical protein
MFGMVSLHVGLVPLVGIDDVDAGGFRADDSDATACREYAHGGYVTTQDTVPLPISFRSSYSYEEEKICNGSHE